VTEGPSRGRDWSDRREQVRLLAAIVVVVAFVVLAVLAIKASRSSLALGSPTRAAHEAPEQVGIIPSVPTVPAQLATSTAPLSVATAVAASSSDQATDVTGGEDQPTTTTTTTTPPALGPASTFAACPALGLLPPEDVGGLQNLVALIPLFGPFSPEAFAMLPAFQPGIDALGPLFPVFGRGLDAAAPVLSLLTPVEQQLTQAGFDALAPLYTPFRPQFLAAEQQLAAQLQPVVQQLATAPGSECLVDLEAVLAQILA
jgi:hypothetical protein